MSTAAEFLLAFVALYPVCTAALWMAGGPLFHVLDETDAAVEPEGGWPGVTVLIPAFNEAPVVATSVAAAMASTTRSWRCWCSTTAPPTTPKPPRWRRWQTTPAAG